MKSATKLVKNVIHPPDVDTTNIRFFSEMARLLSYFFIDLRSAVSPRPSTENNSCLVFSPPCRAYSSNVVAPGIACVFVSASDGGWGGIFSIAPALRVGGPMGAFPRSTRECGVVVFLHGGLRLGRGRLLSILCLID